MCFLLPAKVTNALTVIPVRLEVTADPGGTVVTELQLVNEQDTPQTYYSSYEKFESRGESGQPFFTSSTTGLASWMHTDASVTLQPKESKKIPLIINVPAGADPGGHFAAVFWSSTPPGGENSTQVSLGARLGQLVLLRVSGDIEYGGGIIEAGIDGSAFVTDLPMQFFYRFQNDGGDRVKPSGLITIRNIFGMRRTVLNANISEGNVLPYSIRRYEVPWYTKTKSADANLQAQLDLGEDVPTGFFAVAKRQWQDFLLGPYTATLEITYAGSIGEEYISEQFRFFALPWQLLIIVLAVLSVVFFGGRKAIRSYNRWVIAKVEERMKNRR